MIFEIFKVGVELFNQANEVRWTPDGLEGDLLLFFKDLKKAIDSKNIKRIEKLISEKYQSYTFEASNKARLIEYFQSTFNKIPPFTHPSLEIEICKIPEVKAESVSLVIRTIFNLQLLGISLFCQPFGALGRIAVLLERDANFGLFSIIQMEAIDGE